MHKAIDSGKKNRYNKIAVKSTAASDMGVRSVPAGTG